MANKTETKNNHFIGEVQTKPWTVDGHISFIDTIQNDHDRKGKRKLFADYKIFPQSFEDYLGENIESFIESIRNGQSSNLKSYKEYKALWLIFLTAGLRIGRARKQDDITKEMLDNTATLLNQHADIAIAKQEADGFKLALFKSETLVFFPDSCLFAVPYPTQQGTNAFDRAAIGYALTPNSVILNCKEKDLESIKFWISKNPEWLRICSVSSTSKKVVYHPKELDFNSIEKLKDLVMQMKVTNKTLLELTTRMAQTKTDSGLW